MALVPITELDAVNMMLMSIGQSPVNTITATGIKDVNTAVLILENTSRSVQTKGWTFNTDYAYEIAPNGDDRIAVPANALHIDPVNPGEDFVQRYDEDHSYMAMWDLNEQTFERTEILKVDIHWMYAFEKIPQAARNYIALKSARVFQSGAIASDILFRFEQYEEDEALAILQGNERRVGDRNMLTGPSDFTAQIFKRRRHPGR
jgi:hypothetical protein